MLQRIGVCLVTCVLVGVPGTWAQGVSQSVIEGTVRDHSGGVVPAVTVSISSDVLIGGSRVVQTTPAGTYRAVALPAGPYAVEASATGFQPVRRDGVLLEAGALAVVDLTLEVAGVQDQVTIEAHPGGVDVRSPAAPFRIDQTLLFNLPTTRDVSRLINLVPGVAADVAYGGSQRSNALTVDGTTMTEPSFQDPQVRVNQNWVEQVHVTGLGAAAEYGGTTGVAANSVLAIGRQPHLGVGRVLDDPARLARQQNRSDASAWVEASAA